MTNVLYLFFVFAKFLEYNYLWNYKYNLRFVFILLWNSNYITVTCLPTSVVQITNSYFHQFVTNYFLAEIRIMNGIRVEQELDSLLVQMLQMLDAAAKESADPCLYENLAEEAADLVVAPETPDSPAYAETVTDTYRPDYSPTYIGTPYIGINDLNYQFFMTTSTPNDVDMSNFIQYLTTLPLPNFEANQLLLNTSPNDVTQFTIETTPNVDLTTDLPQLTNLNWL